MVHRSKSAGNQNLTCWKHGFLSVLLLFYLITGRVLPSHYLLGSRHANLKPLAESTSLRKILTAATQKIVWTLSGSLELFIGGWKSMAKRVLNYCSAGNMNNLSTWLSCCKSETMMKSYLAVLPWGAQSKHFPNRRYKYSELCYRQGRYTRL